MTINRGKEGVVAEKSWMQRTGLTPVRSVLIALLSLVLIGVLWSQFTGTDSSSVTLQKPNAEKAVRSGPMRPTVRTTPNGQAPVNVASVAPATSAKWRPWTRVTLEEATRFNPLALPAELAGPRVSDSQAEQTREEREKQDLLDQQRHEFLENVRVSTIIVGPRGKSACVGGVWVREGDMVVGCLVKEINPDGVVLVDKSAERPSE